MRREAGVPDEQTVFTAADYERFLAIINRDGEYDSLLGPPSTSSSPESRAEAAPSYSLPGPGRNEAAVCFRSPIECARAVPARDIANNTSAFAFPDLSGVNDRRDAYRHCLWQAETLVRASEQFALDIGVAHEKDNPGTIEAAYMDTNNNSVGRLIGRTTPDRIVDGCLAELPPNPAGRLVVLVP